MEFGDFGQEKSPEIEIFQTVSLVMTDHSLLTGGGFIILCLCLNVHGNLAVV